MQVLCLGRAPRTKETLPDFLKWRRVTRPPLVFRGLTGSQRTPGFWGVTHIAEKIKDFPDELRTEEMIQKFLGCLNYSSDFIKDLAKERQELQKLLTKKNQT